MASDLLFGRKPAIQPVGLRLIENYATTLPAAPAAFDHTKGFDGFHMLGNGPDPTLTANGGNPVGDCGVVGSVNVALVDSVETDEPFTIPASNDVVTDYLRYDHGQDEGVALADWLAFWHKAGLSWGKNVGYAPVNFRDPESLWAAANAFGCLYVGIAVPATAQEQTANGQPWDLTGTAADDQIEGGHCVVIIARHAGGGEVATWGMRQAFTDRWWARYGEEAWAVITPSQVERNGDGYGIDLATLQRDLAAL